VEEILQLCVLGVFISWSATSHQVENTYYYSYYVYSSMLTGRAEFGTGTDGGGVLPEDGSLPEKLPRDGGSEGLLTEAVAAAPLATAACCVMCQREGWHCSGRTAPPSF
jgi:hypothetical protein